MRFWDTSGIIPLLVREEGTELVTSWLADDPDIVLWGLAHLEIVSAIERRFRAGLVRSSQRTTLLRRAKRLANACHEVSDLPSVRARAMALLARHPLRAADAAQLGAAILVADPDPSSLTMVVLDRRLALAAAQEGLDVLTWPD